MKENSKNDQQLRETFQKMDEKLAAAREDLKEFEKILEIWEQSSKNLQVLEEFYHSEAWMSGHEEIRKRFPEECFESAGQDSIWDISQQFYFLRIKLLKILSDEFYQSVPEFYRDKS